jgi:hypothetical protein
MGRHGRSARCAWPRTEDQRRRTRCDPSAAPPPPPPGTPPFRKSSRDSRSMSRGCRGREVEGAKNIFQKFERPTRIRMRICPATQLTCVMPLQMERTASREAASDFKRCPHLFLAEDLSCLDDGDVRRAFRWRRPCLIAKLDVTIPREATSARTVRPRSAAGASA